MERDLAREVGRMLRKREGISLHRLNQIFSPKAMQSVGKAAEEGSVKRKLSLAAKAAGARARKQLFSLSSKYYQSALLTCELGRELASYPGFYRILQAIKAWVRG